MFSKQAGIVWTITTGVDLTGADSIALRLRKDGESDSRDLVPTKTTSGCTLTTDSATFPTAGTYLFQVIATYTSPPKQLISDVGMIDVFDRIVAPI